MTFEGILPGLRLRKKLMCEQDGLEQKTTINCLIPLRAKWGGSGSDTTINVSGEGEGFSMWSPTPYVF